MDEQEVKDWNDWEHHFFHRLKNWYADAKANQDFFHSQLQDKTILVNRDKRRSYQNFLPRITQDELLLAFYLCDRDQPKQYRLKETIEKIPGFINSLNLGFDVRSLNTETIELWWAGHKKETLISRRMSEHNEFLNLNLPIKSLKPAYSKLLKMHLLSRQKSDFTELGFLIKNPNDFLNKEYVKRNRAKEIETESTPI